MEPLPVIVKHQGKRYDVELEPNTTGDLFKSQLYSLTGVEPERQKILVKGKQLKDDMNLSTLGLKAGHLFMMMGTPSSDGAAAAVVRPPKEAVRFVEDMTEAEAAKAAGAMPSGLQNLGNTCYLNSTLQTLRAVPELQAELQNFKPTASGSNTTGSSLFGGLGQSLDGAQGSSELTTSLRDLYQQMSETQEGFPPFVFLNTLRTVFPQFAQKAKSGNGFAQQDAEEAWSQIISRLRQTLQLKDSAGGGGGPAAATTTNETSGQQSNKVSFVDKYFAGRTETILECDEPAAKEGGEEAIKGEDVFLKLDCHIDQRVNHLGDGLLAGLEEKIEKRSSVLGRDAVYTKKSRIARLPKYLTVHFVRFYWKRDVQKKAKILKKVTFPPELDVVEYCTEGLKRALVPIRDKIRDVRKDEQDIERARKRQKRSQDAEAEEKKADGPVSEGQLAHEQRLKAGKKTTAKGGDQEMPDVPIKTDAEIEAERFESITRAKKEIVELIDPSLAADDGANKTGLYELRAIITHQGASADSGHYTAYVKKDGKDGGEADGKWWWFNDDKVSEVDAEKIEGLSGGGETHSALILLYRAIPLPTVESSSSKEAVKSES
ncbi:MAG: deubiquitinating enzyme [Watsoniomyces obsoletus]|nr:MAG: deubiquitinating enzyme [Watsoniomyces obsoletus]